MLRSMFLLQDVPRKSGHTDQNNGGCMSSCASRERSNESQSRHLHVGPTRQHKAQRVPKLGRAYFWTVPPL
jgi:hypothetical protein